MDVIEVSETLKGVEFENRKSWGASPLEVVKCGLYLMILDNTGDGEVRDKNKRGGVLGRVVVPGAAISVKFGKFECGFLERMKGYYKHLHRPPEAGFSVFQSILKSCYCLDLSSMARKSPRFNPARIYEPFWNGALHVHLVSRGALCKNQNMRSEYRVINSRMLFGRDDLVGQSFLNDVAMSIDASFVLLSKNI